jgi:hypothetical protein
MPAGDRGCGKTLRGSASRWQAWIESLNGHVKAEYPHLLAIGDPAILRAELAVVRERYNVVRLRAGIGCVTPKRRTPRTR